MAKNKAKMNKFLTGAITATMVATAVAPVASAAAFTDLDRVDDSVKAEITKAVELGFFKDADKFNPGNNITRGQAALTLARHIVGSADADVADLIAYVEEKELEDTVVAFEDVPASFKDGADFQAELYYASLIVKDAEAFTQKSLTPTDYVTRSQMAKIITNSFGLEKELNHESKITDIDHLDNETKGFIETIESVEVTNVTAFHPAGNVTRSQMASFLVRAYDVVGIDKNAAPKLISVSADTSKSAKVSLSGNTDELTAKSFKVVGDGLSVVNVEVKGNNATVEFNKDMTDGAEYTLQIVDEEHNVISEMSFKYELGSVASIALTKSSFEAGERVIDFLKVLDDNGVGISSADYNILEVQSSNTDVVDNNKTGLVKAEGTANVRFKIEYKDGSIEWSDFLTVEVAEAVTAELAGYHLNNEDLVDDEINPVFDNTVDYRMKEAAGAVTTLYESDSDVYLEVYADDSKGNPEISHLELNAGGDYEVESLSTNVATVSQDDTGTKLNYVAPGEAKILITGKDNYKKTITVKVSKDPIYTDLVLGATELKLSDETLANLSDVDDVEAGVTEDTVKLKWKDQNDVQREFDLTGATVNDNNQIVLEETGIVAGDKLVISTANTKGAFDINVNSDGELEVTANTAKEVKDASIRVSYYADATNDKPTTQKIISTSVADIDATKAAADYQTIVHNSSIDPNGPNNTATVIAYAIDSNGNKVGNVTDEITLTANEAVTNSEEKWFVMNENTVTFAADTKYYMTESNAIKVNYTVAGSSNPHGFVTLNYENSFAAPDKAVVNTKPTVIEVTDVHKYSNGQIRVQDLLFGKILANSPDLVIDNDDNKPVATSPSIAVKQGKTGYVNSPILSFLDNKGKAVDTGAKLYGLEIDTSKSGNGYVVDLTDGSYIDGTKFDVEYSISNDKNLTQSANGTVDNTLTIDGEDQASFTIVITKVTAKGDPRIKNNGDANKKNLLDSPKSINVILK